MKGIQHLATIITFAFMTSSAISAEPVQAGHSHDLTIIGTVSVDHATTISEVESNLAAKAEAIGGSRYRITSITGNNLLHGTAIVYK